MRPAARRYPSIKVGEKVCTSATLSKPLLTVSAGRNAVGSTSSARICRTSRAYSARFTRWNGPRPGSGDAPAIASMRASRAPASADSVAGSGRFAPGGGIMPARSFRIIFWVVSRAGDAASGVQATSDNPPAFPRSLWHAAQYCATTAACSETGMRAGGGGGGGGARRAGGGGGGRDGRGGRARVRRGRRLRGRAATLRPHRQTRPEHDERRQQSPHARLKIIGGSHRKPRIRTGDFRETTAMRPTTRRVSFVAGLVM